MRCAPPGPRELYALKLTADAPGSVAVIAIEPHDTSEEPCSSYACTTTASVAMFG